MKRGYIAYTLVSVGLLLIVMAAVVRQNRPAWQTFNDSVVEIFPAQTNEVERCLTCHDGIEEISPSHPVEEFGCISCHGGVGTALDKDLAHTGTIRNPASLTTASAQCGGCHSNDIYRVERSVQATYTGAIALVRRAFGAQPDEIAQMGMLAVQAKSGGADTVVSIDLFEVAPDDLPPLHQFAENCLNCHLEGEPIHADYFYRSTGCATCHMLYANDGLYTGGDPTIPKEEPGHPIQHSLTTAIPYWQCNHCHNRGNYELATMGFVVRSYTPPSTSAQRRAAEYYQPIGQFTRCEWELDCIDCHTQEEVMGDGHIYNNQTAAQYTQCKTCHGTLTEPPLTAILTADDEESITKITLNPYIETEIGQTVIATERGELFTHVVQQSDGSFLLTGRAHGIPYDVPLVMNSACQQNPDEQESRYCHECHTYER